MGFWNPSESSESSRTRSHSHRTSRQPSAPRSNSFNFFGSSSRSYGSSSRARPRSGFVNKVRRFLRRIYEFMRRHPLRVFFLVILPLITSGALVRLMRSVGLRLPARLESLVGKLGGPRALGQSERFFARGGARDFGGGSALSGLGGSGIGETIGGLMGIAKNFI